MRVFKVISTLVVAILVAVGIFGCGGSSGGSSNPFTGAYSRSFNRGGSFDTAILIAVDKDGTTSATISDGGGVLYTGSGTTTKGGSFNATLLPPSNSGKVSAPISSVSLAATFYGDDTAGVDLTGAITDFVTVDKLSSPPIQGSFSGEYGGDDTGTFDLTITSNGHVTGTAHTSGGDVNITGNVNEDGSVNFDATGFAGGATWTGFFFLTPNGSVAGTGTWSDHNGDSGTWEASLNI